MLHDSQTAPKYERIMLKISGEALMGEQGFGLHPPTVERIAREVKTVHDLGVEICLVIGVKYKNNVISRTERNQS